MIRMLAVFLCCCSLFAADNLDSLLNAQRIRAGSRADTLFEFLDPENAILKADENADLRFLLAYLPLSDIACMTGDELLGHVRVAARARKEFSWRTQVSDELFRNFVLPHRVTQEPYLWGWLPIFHDELMMQVRNRSMTEAALEVNHWCHEHATYQPSDSRDQDPLTTIRAGVGRCEEEMILAICALRSVGIPARQCYTPYWPHTDDNHAWVEVWADGQWHYFSACEPDVALDRAWFTDAAARTMLVVSTSYGKYEGDEPVLREVGKTTLINSTAVYGPTHVVRVRLEDHRGKPAAKQNIVFSLFNYGAIVPAISLETDEHGEVNLVCGLGDWFISAGKDNQAVFRHLTVADTNVVLRLQSLDSMRALTSVEFIPPPAVQKADSVKQDSLFACRITNEDKIRERFWKTWADKAGIQIDSICWKPDSLQVEKLRAFFEFDSTDLADLYKYLKSARGNWGNLYRYLFGSYPEIKDGKYDYPYSIEEERQLLDVSRGVRARWQLLSQLTEKDRRDFSLDVLDDHGKNMTLKHPSMEGRGSRWRAIYVLPGPSHDESPEILGMYKFTEEMDSSSRNRFEKYVIAPRIDKEPSRAWRRALFEFLNGQKKLIASDGDKRMMKWLRKNITIDKDRDRLGPPLTPAECLNLRRGTVDDIERLYVGLCRVREIPSRFDPVSNRLQRWEKDAWLSVDLGIREKRKESSIATGFLTLLPADSDSTTLNARYNREWGVQMWDKNLFSDVDFGFETAFKDQTWPQELPVGLYCLTSGVRRKDGSVPLKLEWFEIKKGGQIQAYLQAR